MTNIIIGVVIALYSGFIIYIKVKDIKKGKYCGCNCDQCKSRCKEQDKDKL